MTLEYALNNRAGSQPAEEKWSAESEVSYVAGSSTQMIVIKQDDEAFFTGKTKSVLMDRFLSGEQFESAYKLLLAAINNRTRERNFFRLSEQLASGEISENIYEAEIKNNEDEYVIRCDYHPSKEELLFAIKASSFIKDVQDDDDLSVLFSFDSNTVRGLLK